MLKDPHFLMAMSAEQSKFAACEGNDDLSFSMNYSLENQKTTKKEINHITSHKFWCCHFECDSVGH